MKEVAPDLFVESSYPPYNLVLIRTSSGGIVVDCPPNPMHTLNWLEQARAMVGELRYVVMTDAKRERQLATAVCNVPIIATATTMRMMHIYDEERPRRDFLEELAARYPEETAAFEKLAPHKPALAFSDSFTLYAADHNLHFEAVAGSGPGSLWITMPDVDLLIAGDTVVADEVPPMAETPDSKAWLDTMAALAHRQHPRTIVPGRGKAPISNGEIEAQREFMRVMRRAARTLARRGANGLSLSQTAQELGQTFFNRKGQKAVKQIRASLEHLVAELEAEQNIEETETEETADDEA